MRIETKAENYRLYEAGHFGNKLRTWRSLIEIHEDSFTGRVVMRYKGRAGGARYPRLGEHVTLEEAASLIQIWKARGADVKSIAFNEAAPDEALLLQGEVMLSTQHVSLFWSEEKTTMRRAMAKATQTDGLRAIFKLRSALFPSSLNDLEALFELYPDSVIEFSAYRFALGSLPSRNTVIWEVRNY